MLYLTKKNSKKIGRKMFRRFFSEFQDFFSEIVETVKKSTTKSLWIILRAFTNTLAVGNSSEVPGRITNEIIRSVPIKKLQWSTSAISDIRSSFTSNASLRLFQTFLFVIREN